MLNIKKQSGVGLIEVLVTALILGGSLMALSALQARSLQYNHSAYLRSQANIIAYDIIDRIRIKSNVGQVANVEADLEEVATNLPPGAEVRLENCTSASCTIEVEWPEANSPGVEGEGEGTTTFQYTTRLW